QGEIRKVSDDGIWKQYKGECASNYPSGEGQMLMGIEGDPYLIEVDGDFGDESSLMYFATDEKGKLIEVGGIRGGEFGSYLEDDADVPWISYSEEEKNYQEMLERDAASQAERDTESYLGTEEYEARYAERYAEIYDERYSEHINSKKDDGSYGKYFGQTDENGIPNGYGYYVAYTTYNDIASGLLTDLCKIGTWKDGHIDGYYTTLQTFGTVNYREDGCIKDGNKVGDFISYENRTYNDGSKRDTIVKMNLDEVNSYQLCEDGAYRTGYRITECYNSDGTKSHQEVRYRRDNSASGYITYLGEPCVIEGFYRVYDENGRPIDEGRPANGGTTEGWESTTPRNNSEDLWETVRIVVPLAAGFGIGVYFANKVDFSWENSEGKKMVDRTRDAARRSTEDYFASNAKREELLEQARNKRELAERESGYRRNDLLKDAEKLEREAETYHRGIFS
ncbi:MAG: hypothetical protein K2G87_11200, partial [Oscillospiraceae bacterium]|nr:hypothetical protein [Oscillospiraceae bacterium]